MSLKINIPNDKLKHVVVGGMLGVIFIIMAGLGVYGWLTVLAIAVGKELIWDKLMGRGTPEFLDVVASMEIPNLTMIFYFVIKYWDTIWHY